MERDRNLVDKNSSIALFSCPESIILKLILPHFDSISKTA